MGRERSLPRVAALVAALALSVAAAGLPSMTVTAGKPPQPHPRAPQPSPPTDQKSRSALLGPGVDARAKRLLQVPARPSRTKVRRPFAQTRADLRAGLPAAGSPPARDQAMMAYDAATHQLVLFGGSEGQGSNILLSHDTWTWNGSTWTQQFPATTPPERAAAAMAYDAATQQVILFGGTQSGIGVTSQCQGSGFCNDTWAWNGSNWTKLTPAHSPPSLAGPSMAYDAATSSIVLFGGNCSLSTDDTTCGSSGPAHGTWLWNGSDWTKAVPAQSPPGIDFNTSSSLTFDATTNHVVFDTGTALTVDSSSVPAIWSWDGSTWTQIGSPPSNFGIGGGAIAFDPGVNAVVYHAFGDLPDPPYGNAFSGLTFELGTQGWNELFVPETALIFGPTLAYDPDVGALVQFGGYTNFGQTTHNDLFLFIGNQWIGGSVLPGTMSTPSPDMFRTHCDCGRPVDTASGNFWHTFTDFSVPGRGVNLDLNRTYSAANASVSGRLGFGWSDSYSAHLAVDATTGNVTLQGETGDSTTFLNSGGHLTAPAGSLSTLVRNGDGSFTLTRNDHTQLGFDASGNLTGETDRNGYTTSLSYTGGQLSAVTDPGGRSLTFTYGSNGLLASVTDPLQRRVTYGYDAAGELTSTTNPAGGVWTFTYDSAHRMLSMTDPRGGTLTNVYDASGRVTSQTDPLQRTTQFSYTGPATIVTDPRGIRTVYVYSSGELTEKLVNAGSFPSATWDYQYTSNLAVSLITDPNFAQTTQTFDASGNLLTKTDPNGHTTTYTYNSFNEPTSTTDATGVTTTNTYDARGNLTQSSTPLSGTSSTATTTYAYGDSAHPGDVTRLTDADGNPTTYTYDQFGDRASATDGAGARTTWTYDAAGRVSTQVSPIGNGPGGNPGSRTVQYTYDPLDDLTATTLPLSGSPQVLNTYDADQNRTSTTDADGNRTSYVFDADNQQTEVHRPDGSVVGTAYDADGNVTSVTDGLGQAIVTYAYDGLNHKSSAADGLGRTTTYKYLGGGRLSSLTDPGGRTTSFGYDQNSNLTSIRYSDGVTPNVSLTYDALDQRASMSDGTGTSTYTYDSLHRLTGYTNGAGSKVGYTYDLKGQLTGIAYPTSGHQVTRAFDAAGHLTSVKDWLGNATAFSYDLDGNLITESYPNGVTASLGYDTMDRLTSRTDARGGASLLQLAYTRSNAGLLTGDAPAQNTYDPSTRLTGTTSSSAATTYGYDAADRLTTVGTQVGTTTSTHTSAYDAADQLQSTTGSDGTTTSFGYDANGNRTSQATTNLTYDQANRLTGWGTTATYRYDGDGLRMSKTVGGASTAFTWDPSGGTPVLIAAGGTSYVTGPDGHPLEQIDSSGAVSYFHQDQLGSTRLLTDPSGAAVATFTYDPWGTVVSQSGTASTDLLFAGESRDSESGLYYLRGRYYDPATSQFISRDALVSLTQHPYAYAGDDPVNRVDPSGQYDYQYTWDIGPVQGTGGADQALIYFKKHAQQIFPFPISCSQIVLKADCNLQPIPGSSNVSPVEISSSGPCSFTFTSLPGHFDQPGSTITFTIYSSAGQIHLTQTAHAPGSPWFINAGAPEIAWWTWSNMAANLRLALYHGPIPQAGPHPSGG